MRDVARRDVEEYLDTFSRTGLTHVCSREGIIHIFKAKKGTLPKYSESESVKDKMNRITQPVKTVLFNCVRLTIIL